MSVNGRSRPPAFQFYAADWLADAWVRRMSLAQRGAYADLLAYQWREGVLPNDSTQLARLIGASEPEFAVVWVAPLADRFAVVSGGLQNERLERQRAGLERYSRQQAAAGRRGGIAKSRRHLGTVGSPHIRQAFASSERLAKPSSASASASATAAAAVGPDLHTANCSVEALKALEILSGNLRPEYYEATLGIVRAAQNPSGVLLSIRSFGPGGIDEQVGIGWDLVGKALFELASTGTAWAPARLRAFIRRLRDPDRLAGCGAIGTLLAVDMLAECRRRGLTLPHRYPEGFTTHEAMEKFLKLHEGSLVRDREASP